MIKLVNVYPNAPITTINPPIRTRLNNINMSVEDIRKCLIATAYVEEILDNYYSDSKDAKDLCSVDTITGFDDFNEPDITKFNEIVFYLVFYFYFCIYFDSL